MAPQPPAAGPVRIYDPGGNLVAWVGTAGACANNAERPQALDEDQVNPTAQLILHVLAAVARSNALTYPESGASLRPTTAGRSASTSAPRFRSLAVAPPPPAAEAGRGPQLPAAGPPAISPPLTSRTRRESRRLARDGGRLRADDSERAEGPGDYDARFKPSRMACLSTV
jgi:hypothetical protein